MVPTKFLLGDIVAIKSHHFEENLTKVLYKGDPLQQSPLMVISEILLPKKDTEASAKKSNQYKCIWFSVRLQRFEQVWFHEHMIKLILRDDDMISEKLPIGENIIFKTLPLEISKLKTSFMAEFENTDVEKRKSLLTPLLSFISPVLTITGHKDNKISDGVIIMDTQLFKVKWFNAQGKAGSWAGWLLCGGFVCLPMCLNCSIGLLECLS